MFGGRIDLLCLPAMRLPARRGHGPLSGYLTVTDYYA
jgi:hypothetical protein